MREKERGLAVVGPGAAGLGSFTGDVVAGIGGRSRMNGRRVALKTPCNFGPTAYLCTVRRRRAETKGRRGRIRSGRRGFCPGWVEGAEERWVLRQGVIYYRGCYYSSEGTIMAAHDVTASLCIDGSWLYYTYE